MSSPLPLVSFDTETTGTDPSRHRIWELAAVRRELDGSRSELELQTFVHARGAKVDPKALEIGNFAKRFRAMDAIGPLQTIQRFNEFAAGAVIMGLNVSFDLGFLRPLLERSALAPAWHYSPVDIKSLAGGALGIAPPWSSDELAAALDIDPDSFERHSALGDCYLGFAIYDAALELKARSGALSDTDVLRLP